MLGQTVEGPILARLGKGIQTMWSIGFGRYACTYFVDPIFLLVAFAALIPITFP